MKIIANDLYLKTAIAIMAMTLTVTAGVLKSLDNEMSSLVAQAEPYLVTVEAKFGANDRVYVGSGTLIDSDGYIITTTSVVGDALKVNVHFKDGAEYEASVVGKDYSTGIALLQIMPVDRPVPEFGNAYALKEGSWIIAIGNSYEISNAVNLGIYSGLTDEGFLQLSVQTGPGGSGSAIFNTDGEIIGLLVAQASESVSLSLPAENNLRINPAKGSIAKPSVENSVDLGLELPSSAISLAIPLTKLEQTIEQLKKNGDVKHGFLGIRQKALSEQKKQVLGLNGGVEVINVVTGSVAAKAGLKNGDIISKYNGETIISPGHLFSLVRSQKPQQRAYLELYRGGTRTYTAVTLADAPNDGYFGFRQLPKNEESELSLEPVSSTKILAGDIQATKNRLAELKDTECRESVEELESKLAEIENEIVTLDSELKNLNSKLNQK